MFSHLSRCGVTTSRLPVSSLVISFISDHIYLILLLKLQPIRDKAIGHCNGNEKNWESSFVREDEAVGARAWGVVSGAL